MNKQAESEQLVEAVCAFGGIRFSKFRGQL